MLTRTSRSVVGTGSALMVNVTLSPSVIITSTTLTVTVGVPPAAVAATCLPWTPALPEWAWTIRTATVLTAPML